jgi:hypothetical protein
MTREQYFLVRRVADGTCRTVMAYSTKGAMTKFLATYRPPVGEIVEIKLRGGGGDWEAYKVYGR